MATKYKCPYCDARGLTKEDLAGHIDDQHREMIPEGWSAGRLAFKIIYKKDHGTCVVCKKDTQWNEKRCKYQRLCGDPKCKKALRDAALKNHIKVYKCKTLLNDPIHQEEMLRHRKISGEYTFTDGGKIGYVGSYEKKFLEFMDKTLECKSSEIIEPGPKFVYEIDGEKHFWITDFLYVPYNLVIEVKDGGDNPNKRNMPEYRKKERAKDKLITEKGTYNYLKLTNNNFAQLLEIFAEMRMQMINDGPENKRVVIRINEDVDLMNEAANSNKYAIPLDLSKLKNDEFIMCINTHPTNMAVQGTQLSVLFSAIISAIWGVAFIPQLIFMMKFQGMIYAATAADQIFARDFALFDSSTKDNWSDKLNGFPIVSVADGRVIEVKKYQMPYGNCIIIQHDNCYSLYAHIIEGGIKVREGQAVNKGQVIGYCGSTGNSSGPHLHFEMTWTKPGGTFSAVPKRLTNFENTKVRELSWDEIYLSRNDNKVAMNELINKAKDKSKWKNTNGDIPSICIMGKS